MDFVEKAKIRLEHWKTHNDYHLKGGGICTRPRCRNLLNRLLIS